MFTFKTFMLNAYYKIKFRKHNLKIGKKAEVLTLNSDFEGYNCIGERSQFKGSLGYGSYIGRNSYINATVGKFTCISDRVNIVSGTHPTKGFVSSHPAFYSTKKQSGFTFVDEDKFQEERRNPINPQTSVYIGNDVWIGCDVTILGGVVIGDGAVIASGSMVTSDVEPYTIVVGVPAKPLRKKFSDDIIDFLLDFKWWDRDIEWIRENSKYFQNIEEFAERYNV